MDRARRLSAIRYWRIEASRAPLGQRMSGGLSRSDRKDLPDFENLVREFGSVANVRMSRVEWPLELSARPSDATRTG